MNKMVSSIWRTTRADKIEAGLLADAILSEQRPGRPPDAVPASDVEPLSPEANPRALEFGRAYARKSGLISALARYRTRLDRDFYKALEELRIVRYARVSLTEQFVAANLKKFPVSPEEIKKESAMTNRLLQEQSQLEPSNQSSGKSISRCDARTLQCTHPEIPPGRQGSAASEQSQSTGTTAEHFQEPAASRARSPVQVK